MREEIDRRVQLRPRKLGVEQRLLDTRGADAEIGVVSDGFGDRGRQLIVAEPREPVIGHHAGARAGRRPLRGRLQRGQRLLSDGRGVGRRLQRTPGDRRYSRATSPVATGAALA